MTYDGSFFVETFLGLPTIKSGFNKYTKLPMGISITGNAYWQGYDWLHNPPQVEYPYFRLDDGQQEVNYNSEVSEASGEDSITQGYSGTFYKLPPTNYRLIGVVEDYLKHGGLQVKFLTNHDFSINLTRDLYYYAFTFNYGARIDRVEADDIYVYRNARMRAITESGIGYFRFGNKLNYEYDQNPSFEKMQIGTNQRLKMFNTMNCKQGSTYIDNSKTLNITSDPDTTLTIGIPFPFIVKLSREFSGRLLPLLNNVGLNSYMHSVGGLSEFLNKEGEQAPKPPQQTEYYSEKINWSYNHDVVPYNVILTEDLTAAKKYIEDGTLPSDAFLIPWETINDEKPFPEDAGEGDGDGDSGDDGDENGDDSRNTDPTPTVTPLITPQKLTNNNLYWMSEAQIKSFISWFWNEAGEIIDAGDLWDKIKGLYEDLASSIINIRYMPIDISWVGSTSSVTGVNVGMINDGKTVDKIVPSNPTVRDIGSIFISEKYKSFCDYTPYANLILYLPFHGFLTLDADVFMKHTLNIKCLYDIVAGAIQYFVYCDDYLVNSLVAKMAVDIPITLQSKNDRDSAIFQNIVNFGSGITSLAISAVSGNPAGIASSVGGVLNSIGNATHAPLAMVGNVGETGAFYAPQKCAIYLRRPSYNRPSNYGSRVGFPCNKQYKLSSLKGFTQCQNPYIKTFTDVTLYQDEITDLYDQLERGVIL